MLSEPANLALRECDRIEKSLGKGLTGGVNLSLADREVRRSPAVEVTRVSTDGVHPFALDAQEHLAHLGCNSRVSRRRR